VAEIAHRLGRVAAVGMRINPDVTTKTHPYTQTGGKGMKFGIPGVGDDVRLLLQFEALRPL